MAKPYSKLSDLPEGIKKLPKHAQEIYMAAFNNAWDQYGEDPEKAAKVAWSAVETKYEKDKDGNWVAKKDEKKSADNLEVRSMKLNSKGVGHARSLIAAGKVDRSSGWGFSGEDGNKILGKDNWDEYSKWFLATDPDEDQKTKAHYKYPYGKDGKVYRSGVIAAKQRAAQQKESDIAAAADSLLQAIDKDKKEEKTVTKAKMFFRQFEIKPDDIDKDKRTVKLSFSSETPVDRYYGTEILDHSPSSVRMGRLQSGGPLLVNHNPDDQVGVVEKANLGTDRVGRAEVRFGKSARAEEVFNDVQDGIRKFTSTGYRVYRMAEEGDHATAEEPCYRATDWEPHEISIASIPADPSVGVGRSSPEENELIMVRMVPAEPAPKPPGPIKKKEERNMEKCTVCQGVMVDGKCPFCETRALELKRIKEINAIADKFKDIVKDAPDMARRSIEKGDSEEVFRRLILDAVGHPDPTPSRPANAKEKVFRSFGEQLQYIAVMSDTSPGSRRAVDLFGSDVTRHWMDFNRAISGMSVSVPSDGGFMVQTEFTTALLQKAWETGILLGRCSRIPVGPDADGLEGPYIDETSRATGSRWGGVQIYRRAEAVEATNKQPKLGKFEIRLEDLKGLAYITNRLLRDATALEAWVSRGFLEEFGFVADNEIIRGSGVGEMLGVLNCGAFISVSKEGGQAAKTIVFENLVKMYARMLGKLRPAGVWFYNQEIEPQLFSLGLSIGVGGVPVWMPAGGLSNSPYSSLFGRPMIPIEQAEALGTVGDIMFLNLGEYIVIDKGGIEAAQSMHARFIYDEMTFKWTYRINGMPATPWRTVLTPFKGAGTLSPFIGLQTRS
jgi:HK97 family phage major capsid protein